MVRLEPGRPRPSTTTRRSDLPERIGGRRGPESAGAVLRGILDHGPVARSNLARLTGLSPASMTGITASLLAHGLVREVPEAAGPPGFGRPHVPLDLDAERVTVLGVHFSVPFVTVALLDIRGRVLARNEVAYDRPSLAEAVGLAAAAVAELRADNAWLQPLGIGCAIGGWVDASRGNVIEHAKLGWRDEPLADALAAATGLPVQLERHGRALLRAEQLIGSHAMRARESIVQLFVGNVVDAAFSFRGQMHHGPRSASGTIAHMPVAVDPTGVAGVEACSCGRDGCLEATVSEATLLRRAAGIGVRATRVSELAELALAGDERLVEMFVARSRIVGRAAATLLDLFDPAVLTVVEAGMLWIPQAREALLAEVSLGSGVHDDAAHLVAGSSFEDPLAVAGGAVLLDRLYDAPLATARVMRPAS